MAYRNRDRLIARDKRLATARLASQDVRDMIDAIREILGLDPLFYDNKSAQNGYVTGSVVTHREVALARPRSETY